MKRKIKDCYEYRESDCCSNCFYDTIVPSGSMIGHYCLLHESRCCKTKVCKYFESKYDRMDDDSEFWKIERVNEVLKNRL